METKALEKAKREISNVVVQSSFPEEPFHSINTLEWLLKLKPDADDALQIAALGHDIERAYNDKRIQSADYETYNEYKQAHALNSAQILTGIMEKCGVDQEIVDNVAHLVAHHEMGGDEREELLKNADTISFFHVCLPLFFDRKGPDTTRKRCVWGYKKLPEELREIVAELDFMDEELKSLVREALGLE
ncbi:MAG: DUF4202 family protein [Candidatus Latescibacteria bacterium]|jgi:hypothetical protein|nr:DUF4202 family protein [Candidatus Latescibacterota bacterium]